MKLTGHMALSDLLLKLGIKSASEFIGYNYTVPVSGYYQINSTGWLLKNGEKMNYSPGSGTFIISAHAGDVIASPAGRLSLNRL